MINWKVPFSDIDIGKEEIEGVIKVINSKWLTMGEITQRFEDQFRKFLGVKFALAASSGTAALHLALLALGIGKGDEVICPSLTFVATANSILYVGAKPIFADITSFDNLNISPEDIERRITPKTKAIIVVHYGGFTCEMDKILSIAKKHRIKVIEDAAHAPGAEYKGKKCGTIGDVGCFSFFSNKNMTTGEGGMVVTNDAKIAERIKRMRSHGMTTMTLERHKGHAFSYDVTNLGFNYRFAEINAAIGLVQLKKLDKNNQRRAQIARWYKEYLGNIDEITMPFENFEHKSSHHLFPIILDKDIDRAKFINFLRKSKIQCSVHYRPVHSFSFYKKFLGNERIDLPITEEAGKREVSLPIFAGMEKEAVKYVVKKIRNEKVLLRRKKGR